MRILDQIDEFLDNQKESEAKLFFFLPILLFGFLSWYILYPITDSNLKNSLNENNQLHANINNFNNQVNSYMSGNLRLKREISNVKQELQRLKNNKVNYDKLINKLKFSKFNLVEWAEFYNNIPILAKKHHIYIYQLDNVMYNINNTNKKNIDKLTQKKMTITISANGNFINFVKFMMEFEKLKAFIRITTIDMTANNLKLTIDIYGTKL